MKYELEKIMNNTTSIFQTYTIGKNLTVNRIGYGAMRLSGQPGNFAMRPRVMRSGIL